MSESITITIGSKFSYQVTLPKVTLEKIQANQALLRVYRVKTTKGIQLNATVIDGKMHMLLGRYILEAGHTKVLRFKDGNRLNHDLSNIYLEDEC